MIQPQQTTKQKHVESIIISKMKRISLIKLKEILNRKDLRSVRKWCDVNNVFIYQRGKKDESVHLIEFDLAYDKDFIEHLKRKIGEGWADAYVMYKNGNIQGLATLNYIISKPKSYHSIKSENKTINQLKTKFNEYAKTINKR